MSDKRDHDFIKFNTQIGVDATVQRKTVSKEIASEPNRVLAKLGLACHPAPLSEGTQYMGSAAVHIYWHEPLAQIFFVSQVDGLNMYKCPEALASKGMDDLRTAMKVLFDRRPGRLRSGF
jgi:hypothetical protein